MNVVQITVALVLGAWVPLALAKGGITLHNARAWRNEEFMEGRIGREIVKGLLLLAVAIVFGYAALLLVQWHVLGLIAGSIAVLGLALVIFALTYEIPGLMFVGMVVGSWAAIAALSQFGFI